MVLTTGVDIDDDGVVYETVVKGTTGNEDLISTGKLTDYMDGGDGDDVIAAGGVGETPQKFGLGTSSAFADLGGTPPKADFIAVVRDFVWLANVDTGSGRVPYQCYWSGFNDPTSWTAGVNQSDFQNLPDSVAITGLVGGEYATILT